MIFTNWTDSRHLPKLSFDGEIKRVDIATRGVPGPTSEGIVFLDFSREEQCREARMRIQMTAREATHLASLLVDAAERADAAAHPPLCESCGHEIPRKKKGKAK